MKIVRDLVDENVVSLSDKEAEILERLLRLAKDMWRPDDKDYKTVQSLYNDWPKR